MRDDDGDLLIKGKTDKYKARPQTLEELCIADFFSFYRTGGKEKEPSNEDDNEGAREKGHNMEHDFRNLLLPKTIQISDHGVLIHR